MTRLPRQRIASGAPWEERVGYSRAVRVGPYVHVSGTTSLDDGGRLVGEGDAYAQMVRIIAIVRRALEAAGSCLEDVVRTRIFVTDISLWEEIGRAHGEAFGAIRPATSMVQVCRLIGPEMLVEMEADAVVDP